MSGSRFYEPDPDDPDAPVVIEEYKGMRVGDQVRYVGPVPMRQETLVISELVRWEAVEGIEDEAPHYCAVLNDGEWEVNADNLEKLGTTRWTLTQ